MKQHSTNEYNKISLAQGQLVLIDKLASMPVPHVVKNEMLIVVLILDGHGAFTISGNTFKASKNDMLIGLPNTILEHFTHSRGFKYRCFAMSTECVVRHTPRHGQHVGHDVPAETATHHTPYRPRNVRTEQILRPHAHQARPPAQDTRQSH